MQNVMNLMQVYKQMKTGNPAQVFQQLARTNPALQPVIQLMNSGTPLKAIVDAELQKQGMTREQAMQTLKEQGLI